MTIGLVGYSCNSGLGELNRQVATYCNLITSWAIKPHNILGIATTPPNVTTQVVSGQVLPDVFFENIDTVLFFESEIFPGSLKRAKALGKRVVCVPMLEWLPGDGLKDPKSWTRYVDLFICPTKQCYDQASAEGYPCAYFPWPCDVKRFPIREITDCTSFLYIHGNGGYKGRKGGHAIYRALKLWPEMPLTIKTLSPNTDQWPSGASVQHSGFDNLKLYDEADVLIYPACVDGIGLQPFEAMSQGIPVITTDGEPWNEIPAVAKVESLCRRELIGPRRVMDWYMASAEDLVAKCKHLHGSNLSAASSAAKEWALFRRWELCVDAFHKLVLGN